MVKSREHSSRRGAGALGCVATMVILVAAILLVVSFGKPWFRYQQFRDVMKSSARYATSLPDSVIRARLLATADSLGLPKAAKRISILRSASPAQIIISSEYIESVQVPLYGTVKVKFKPRAEEAL
ncbi:MAG: hypothetical protein ABJC19_05100 [Gemmatimonadota bacterium]